MYHVCSQSLMLDTLGQAVTELYSDASHQHSINVTDKAMVTVEKWCWWVVTALCSVCVCVCDCLLTVIHRGDNIWFVGHQLLPYCMVRSSRVKQVDVKVRCQQQNNVNISHSNSRSLKDCFHFNKCPFECLNSSSPAVSTHTVLWRVCCAGTEAFQIGQAPI